MHRIIRFALVGGTGFVVNTAVLAAGSGLVGLHYLVGSLLATVVSTTSNFWLTDQWVFRDRPSDTSLLGRYAIFMGLSLVTLVIRGPLLVGLVEAADLHYLLANAISLLTLMALRYRFSGSVIWRRPQPQPQVLR